MVMVKFAIPKGTIEEATLDLLKAAWHRIGLAKRGYRPSLQDPEVKLKLLRPQEIPMVVEEGLQDIGITGKDWIAETKADVETMLDLEYGSVKLVLAVPMDSSYSSLDGLIDGYAKERKVLRISTEYLNIASDYISSSSAYRELYGLQEPLIITPWFKRGSNKWVSVLLSFGATEAKPPEDADAIIDLVETGSTLEQNNLKPIETIMESSAVLIASKKSMRDEAKREKIYDVMTLLKGVIDGRRKLHIFVNVKRDNLEELLSNLPALKKPTVGELSDPDWLSVNTVIDRDAFIKLLPIIRRLAQGLVVHTPHQILPLEEIAKEEPTG